MADYTKNISNALNVFGASPSSQWGIMNWGDKWGEGTADLPTSLSKLVDNSQSLSDTNAYTATYNVTIENLQEITSDLTYEDLQDGSGYNYVFTKPTTNAEDRSITEWDDVAGDTESWTSQTTSSQSWSEE